MSANQDILKYQAEEDYQYLWSLSLNYFLNTLKEELERAKTIRTTKHYAEELTKELYRRAIENIKIGEMNRIKIKKIRFIFSSRKNNVHFLTFQKNKY